MNINLSGLDLASAFTKTSNIPAPQASKARRSNNLGVNENTLLTELKRASKSMNKKDLNEKAAPEPNKEPERETYKDSNKDNTKTIIKNKTAREDHFEKLKRLQKISRYLKSKRFSKYLKESGFKFTPAQLSKKSIDQLDLIIGELELAVCNKNANQFFEQSVQHGLTVIEHGLTDYLDYNVKGTTEVLMNDDEFCDILEEIQLKNSEYTYINPYARGAYKAIGTAMQVNAVHTSMQNMNAQQKEALKARALEIQAKNQVPMSQEHREQLEKYRRANNLPSNPPNSPVLENPEIDSSDDDTEQSNEEDNEESNEKDKKPKKKIEPATVIDLSKPFNIRNIRTVNSARM